MNQPPTVQPAHDHESAPEHEAVSGRLAMIAVVVVILIAAVLAGSGILRRVRNDKVLADTTNELAAPSVIAIPPKPGAPVDNFVLPGNRSEERRAGEEGR